MPTINQMAWWLGAPTARVAHVQALDGLRGLAVLVVIASHLCNGGWLPQPGVSGIGKSGVYLFFVLSAYLLASAMFNSAPGRLQQARYWLNYALRRVLRIWPLYLVVLLLSWALTRMGAGAWHYQLDTTALWAHLRLQQGQSVLWSIPVEFTFYLWLPLIVLLLRGLQRLGNGFLAGGWLALLLLAAWQWPAAQLATNDVHLGGYLVVFLCGVGAAAWQRYAPQVRNPVMWRVLGGLALCAAVVATPALWAGVAGQGFNPELNHRWLIAWGALWALLLLALLRGGGWLARVFSSTPMRFVGVVSFSAYLWHMPIVQLAGTHGMKSLGWLAVPPLLLAIAVASAVSFALFERPWREIRF